MHEERPSPLEFVVMHTTLVKLKIHVYLIFFMNVKFLFSTLLESSMSIKKIVVLNMLVLHMPSMDIKFLFAINILNTCV